MKIRLIFIHILFLIFSCKNPNSGDGMTVFRYNEDNNISTLDPAFARNQNDIWAVSQLFNGLVQLDENLNVIPCIAKRWGISADGKTYTFILRDDVYFHDHELFDKGKGRRLTSRDFVYSLNRIINPLTASPGSWIFNDKIYSAEEVSEKSKEGIKVIPFEAENDSTLVIRLKTSFPPFLGLLSMPYCFAVPEEIAEKFGKDFRIHPVGTGPFRFSAWTEGVKLIFLKNPRYFEKENGTPLPYLDAVSISFIENKQTAFLEFIQGKLDFFNGLEGSYKDELLTKSGQLKQKYRDRFRLEVSPFLNTEYLAFLMDTSLENVRNHPLGNELVRKAINHAIDREKLVLYLRNNIGTPANSGFVPNGLPSFDAEKVRGYDYDPAKARNLLREAGFNGGKNMPPITLYTSKDYLDISVFIQNQLSEIGITSKIEVSPSAFLKEMKTKSKLNFFRGSWIADYPDAENYLALFYSKNLTPAGPNVFHFKDEKFDRLYESTFLETEEKKRNEIYREMDRLVMEKAPVVVLYYDQSVRLIQNNIFGLAGNGMNSLQLKRVMKKDQ